MKPANHTAARAGCAAILAVLTLWGQAPATLAAPDHGGSAAGAIRQRREAAGWRVAGSFSFRGRLVLLTSVYAISADDAWAAGSILSKTTSASWPLIEHWNGSAWRPVPLPGKDARLLSRHVLAGPVGASSACDVWIFSYGRAYLRHTSRGWVPGSVPAVAGSEVFVSSAKVFSPTDVWVFGTRVTGRISDLTFRPYAARFDGTAWTVVPVPGSGMLGAVSALSADDMYAIEGTLPAGSGPSRRPKVLRWEGTAWRVTAAQPGLPANATLSAIFAESPASVWVGGSAPNRRSGTSELARHLAGRSWRPASPHSMPASQERYLSGMVSDGGGGFWAIGDSLSGRYRIWHYASGRWLAPAEVPWDITDLDTVPRTRTVWAVGMGKPGLATGVILVHGSTPR